MSRLRLGAHEVQARLLPLSRMPRPEKENAIKRRILSALSNLPYVLVINTPAGKAKIGKYWLQLAPRGWPDISGHVHNPMLIYGVPFYLEVKVPGEDAEPHQLACHERIRQTGGFVAVVHSVAEAMAAVREARGQ